MFRWFADLPIERKLRVVITVPAMAALRDRDCHAYRDQPAAPAGGNAAACGRDWTYGGRQRNRGARPRRHRGRHSALTTLRDEPMVDIAEVYLPERPENCDLRSRRQPAPDRAMRAAIRGGARGPRASKPISSHGHLPRAKAQCSDTYIFSCRSPSLYPDWRELRFDQPRGHRCRDLDRVLARGAAAAANLGTHRQFGAHHAARVRRGRLQPARRAQLRRTRSAR